MTGPTPDINEFTLAVYHARRALYLRARAKRIRDGVAVSAGLPPAECERYARRRELWVRDIADAAEKSSGHSVAERLQRAESVRSVVRARGLPCAGEAPV